VYIELSGKRIFQSEAAELLIADMQRSMSIISEKGMFDTAHQRERILEIYREGIAVLDERLKKHAADIKSP
jgi:hypothetical protein